MKFRWARFNINFRLWPAVSLVLSLVCGCQTEEGQRKHQLSSLELRLEVNRDATNLSEPVPIGRRDPVMVNVDKEAFLREANIKEAKVVDTIGGFSIRIEFDRQGRWLLEQYSGANPGKRFAIYSQFVMPPAEKLNEARWLAAPRITQRITDGVLVFTPDATREEADQIVLGLNNMARKNASARAWKDE